MRFYPVTVIKPLERIVLEAIKGNIVRFHEGNDRAFYGQIGVQALLIHVKNEIIVEHPVKPGLYLGKVPWRDIIILADIDDLVIGKFKGDQFGTGF